MNDKYQATIGIECHVQLKTKTKLFSGINNDARGAEPNTLVSPICYGMPGVLPVLNEKAVELAVRAGIALDSEIATFSKFDRKQYFYPDLPKGYQITQFDHPIVGRGSIEVPLDSGSTFQVGITRAHLEEDAGKSTHPSGKDYSLVDLNRAGTPLLEIVSEPDIHSAQEARAYAQELYLRMKYADVSDADLYHGNMRFDVNVSVALKESSTLGTRAEVKNLNSFRSVEKATEYEIARQIELLESGKVIVQETRGWDDAKLKTFSQRSKEDAHDYRYFPEPDLPPIMVEKEFIDSIRSNMPPLPAELRKNMIDSGLTSDHVTTILQNGEYVRIIMTAIEESASDEEVVRIANWLIVDVSAITTSDKTANVEKLTYAHMSELYDLIISDKISSSAAKIVLREVLINGGSIEDIAAKNNLLQISDTSAIQDVVDLVLTNNPQAVEDIKNGEEKAIGFLVGQIMKESKGQANPKMAQDLIRKSIT